MEKIRVSFCQSIKLVWCDLILSVFNVGEYRRAATDEYKNHEFFNPNNKEAMEIRE